ncbi:ATP-binding protein [Fusobacterium polymorphum]|uniref:HD domain-containing protein n=1 Tax=Fusobacterium nucleatum subsp. polymorphum TaxID=76857 RepID=UPI002162F2FC|nr:ATP-binding protein [Fusobacterium polymorphum]
MNFFEKILEEKSKQENTIDYFTQWNYDKELYTDILLGIRDYYSNYTDHGKKHSETILTNILRILGEESIKKFSTLDLWLVLEAAYLHDCGMYITREEAKKVIHDDNFKSYYSNILNNPEHPMYSYTQFFSQDKNGFSYNQIHYNVDFDYAMRFIISSYKRSSHAADFRKVIGNSKKLLHDRIYRILFSISESHGKSFEDVMKLPKKENGIGNEIGHPIFIACLLRMGDLLDIDNKRFSEKLIENIEDIIPIDSKEHLEKHKSITHFWIDQERIEITATVNSGEESYNVAEVIGNWFSYIEDEYNNQLHNWNDIIPKNIGTSLPILGELKIDIENYEYINSKNKPKFSLDINNTLSLLMGTSIYDKKEKAIREILQNAIDATYLRVFEENKEHLISKDVISLKEVKQLFENKKIEIIINKISEDKEYNQWDIIIKDKGIGIDKEHLKYIIEAGSSYKDSKKNDLITNMPSWLKPSGNFGIGFQSIFMLTERVNLKSKSLFSQESINVDLIKPASKNYNAGSIYFKKTKFDYKQEIGTVISFRYSTRKISNSYKLSGNFIDNYVYAFDPLIDEEFDIEILSLLDMIKEVNSYSLIDIILKKENEKISLDNLLDENLNFLIEGKYQISLIINDKPININSLFYSEFFYKNQYVDKQSRFLANKFLGVTINILDFKANEVLELNRNKIKDSFIKKEQDSILNEIFNTLYKLYDSSFDTMNEHVKRKISYFWLTYRDSLNLKIEDKLDFEKKLENFLYQDEIVEGISVNSLEVKNTIEIEIKQQKNIDFSYKIENKEIDEYFLKFLIKEISIKGAYILKIENSREIKEGYKIILEKVDSKAKEYIDLEYNIKNFVNTKGWFNPIGRFYTHSNKDSQNLKINYTDMTLKPNQEWIGLRRIPEIYHIFNSFILRNLILFPFYIKSANEVIWNEKIKKEYIEFCYKNRFFKDLSEEDIRKVVEKFVEDLKKKFLDEKIKILEE